MYLLPRLLFHLSHTKIRVQFRYIYEHRYVVQKERQKKRFRPIRERNYRKFWQISYEFWGFDISVDSNKDRTKTDAIRQKPIRQISVRPKLIFFSTFFFLSFYLSCLLSSLYFCHIHYTEIIERDKNTVIEFCRPKVDLLLTIHL